MRKKRKIKYGHGFWIISDYSYRERNQVVHCSACGMPNARPIGKYCRWCGTRMDQKPLELLSGPHITNESNISE